MGYLRSVQPLIAALITDLPSPTDVAAHPGLGDAIIFVDEDGSARRWDAGSQTWTRRGGPLASSYATSAQGALADSSLQNAAAFATSVQGGKADSALQTVPQSVLNHIISGHLDWQQIFIDKVTTTNTVPTNHLDKRSDSRAERSLFRWHDHL